MLTSHFLLTTSMLIFFFLTAANALPIYSPFMACKWGCMYSCFVACFLGRMQAFRRTCGGKLRDLLFFITHWAFFDFTAEVSEDLAWLKYSSAFYTFVFNTVTLFLMFSCSD